MGHLPFFFGESRVFESPSCIGTSPHFVSSSFLYRFLRVRAGDLVSTNQICPPQTLSRKLETQSSRSCPQSILEKVVAATFTPQSGMAEVPAVSVVQTIMSLHRREQECFHWSCLWSHLELSLLEHILHAWLAGLPGDSMNHF